MRECPNCGLQSPLTRDFCPCGEYLRWELTGQEVAVKQAPPVAPPSTATPVQSRATAARAVLLTVVDDAGDWQPRPAVPVEPGGHARLTVRVRNQRGVVDHFRLRLEGVPDDWWTAGDVVHLMPFGSGGTYERDVFVALHPPRSPAAEAREWTVRVVASSLDTGNDVASLTAIVRVEPYEQIEAEVTPELRKRRRRARYRLRLRNEGNAPAALAVTARDESEACRFRMRPETLDLGPGETRECAITARPKRPIWLGAAVERQLEIAVQRGGDAPPVCRTVRLLQRPWLPPWLRWVVPLAVLAVALFLLLHVRVPDVTGEPLDTARRQLDAHGLGFAPPEVRVSKRKVGTVLETIPPAGSSRLRGTDVTLIVATKDGRAKVPDVRGKPYADAVLVLAEAGFEVAGAAPDEGPAAKVTDQVPRAGRRWPRNRDIELSFATKPERGDGPAKDPPVPAVAGASEAEAREALERAGLAPRMVYEISERPAGTVLGSKRGEGDVVVVRVSAGFPQIAYDDGRRIYVADGLDGEGRTRLGLAGDGNQTHASWTPDGRRVAYRAGTSHSGTIWLSGAAAGARAAPRGGRPLTTGAFDDRRPAVSPDGAVVAFVRGASQGDAHRLCFVAIARPGAVSCTRDVGVGVSRPSWSPDGKAILARTDRGALWRFAADRASSPRGRDWTSKGAVPIERLGRVEFAAWSSRGVLAVAITPSAGQPSTIYLVREDGVGQPEVVPFSGIACEVAWRSDGRELLVAWRVDDEGRPCPNTLGSDRGAATRLLPDGSDGAALGDGIVAPAYRPLRLGG